MHFKEKTLLFLKKNKIPIVVFLLAFIIRILVIYIIDIPVANDAPTFIKAAQYMLGDSSLKGFSVRMPGYPLLLAFVKLLFGSFIGPAKVVQVILSSFTCVFVYLIGKDLFSKKVGYTSALIIIFYPSLIVYNEILLSETFFIFLLTGFVFFLLVLLKKKYQSLVYASLTGIFLGLIVLTKEIILLFLPFLVLLFILDSKPSSSKRFKSLFVIMFFVLFFMSLQFVRNYNNWGIVDFEMNIGKNIFIAANSNLSAYCLNDIPENEVVNLNKIWPPSDQNKIGMGKGLDFILNNPYTFLRKFVNNLSKFWWFQEKVWATKELHNSFVFRYISHPFYVLLFFLALAGILFPLKKTPNFLLIYFIIFVNWAGYSLFFVHARYRLPLIPFMAIFAAYTTQEMIKN